MSPQEILLRRIQWGWYPRLPKPCREFLRELAGFGEIGIFGGLPRDLIHMKATEFRSDVDVVIEPHSLEWESLCERYQATKNRYGGYRLSIDGVDFDVWGLERTYAVLTGAVPVKSLREIVHTVCFTSDAILYLPKSKEIVVGDGYWEWMGSKTVGLYGGPCENPAGLVTRAFRFLERGYFLRRDLVYEVVSLYPQYRESALAKYPDAETTYLRMVKFLQEDSRPVFG